MSNLYFKIDFNNFCLISVTKIYTVQGFNTENGEIVFKFSNGDLKTINLYDSDLKSYEGVNPKILVDSLTGDIVKLFSNRQLLLIMISFTAVPSTDYHKWMTKEFLIQIMRKYIIF